MVLDKGHQVSKTDKHHDIDVLIHGVVVDVVDIWIMYFCSYKDSINDDDDDFDEKEQESEDFTISWVKVHKLMGIRL
jgi:hypothetical protein